MNDITKHYTHGDITVVWKPELCQHSTKCFRSLPAVFDLRVKPWIRPENADSEMVIQVVQQCPSGALSMMQGAPPAD